MNLESLINTIKEFYPLNIDFQEFEDVENIHRLKLKAACISALEDTRWVEFKKKLNSRKYNFFEFSLLFQSEPSFIGSIQIKNNDGCQLIFKISVIAKAYSIYFFKDEIKPKNKLLRFEASNKEEVRLLENIRNLISKHFLGFKELDKELNFIIIDFLGNLRLRLPRKPYLDECLYGTYMSIHD